MLSHEEKVEIRNRQLAALHQAALAISGEVALDKVLQQIVDSVRELIGAQYAALGVPNAQGFFETFVYSGLSREEATRIPHVPKGLGLLGALIRDKRPIRISNIADYPLAVGFPPGHTPMWSFLGVPILAGEESLGNLYLTNKAGTADFTADDQEIVEMLAAHAAIAIQNARLYEQIGRLAIIEERTRIGMDLHDGVIQSIYAVGLTLESTRLAMTDNPAEADHLLEVSIQGLNDTIRDIRNFILDLRPHRFQGNLNEGVARLVREFQANTMVNVQLEIPKNVTEGVSPTVARTIFLTTQEALANVARHARAKEVHIRLKATSSAVLLTITDNGRGFNMTKQTHVGHGLSNMRARAEELGGSFHLHSSVGHGTTLSLTLPIR